MCFFFLHVVMSSCHLSVLYERKMSYQLTYGLQSFRDTQQVFNPPLNIILFPMTSVSLTCLQMAKPATVAALNGAFCVPETVI